MGTEMILLVLVSILVGSLLWQLLSTAVDMADFLRLLARPAEYQKEYRLALRYVPCEDIVDFRRGRYDRG